MLRNGDADRVYLQYQTSTGKAILHNLWTGKGINIDSTLNFYDGSASRMVPYDTMSADFTMTGTLNATNFNSTSDITLKENVSLIDNALDMVKKLDGIGWNWKDNGKASLGVSAQNVETVAPELVGQGEHKSVNYNGLIGILIELLKSSQLRFPNFALNLLKKQIQEESVVEFEIGNSYCGG